MSLSRLLAALLLPLTFSASAQQPAPPPDCPPVSTAPSLCFTLDARRAVDTLAGPLVFRWDMGDGNRRQGVLFDYCYAAPGQYTIRLDVVNSKTGEVRANESQRTLDLGHSTPAPHIQAPDTARAGQSVAFELDASSLPSCMSAALRLTWQFGEGPPEKGRRVSHTFRRPGTYVVRLAVEVTKLLPDCNFYPCVSRTITIVP